MCNDLADSWFTLNQEDSQVLRQGVLCDSTDQTTLFEAVVHSLCHTWRSGLRTDTIRLFTLCHANCLLSYAYQLEISSLTSTRFQTPKDGQRRRTSLA